MCPAKNLGTVTMEEKESKYWETHLVVKFINMNTSKVSCFTIYFSIWYL